MTCIVPQFLTLSKDARSGGYRSVAAFILVAAAAEVSLEAAQEAVEVAAGQTLVPFALLPK
jgi:hypothetical protein